MENTLSIIQTLSKIGKILSKIVFVFSIVGAALSLVAVISAAFVSDAALSVGNFNIFGIVADNTGVSKYDMISEMTAAMLICAAEIVVSGFAVRYFKNELKTETPFTYEGAKEMRRLGILSIALPIGALIIMGIVNGIIAATYESSWSIGSISVDGQVSTGVMFIILSLICRYGAEISEKVKEN